MAYTDIDDPSAFFQTTLYTGNGTAIGSGGNAITNGGNSDLQPDLVWIKNRVDTDSHSITDSVRGVTKYVLPDSTSVADTDANGLAVFGSNGFTVGSNNTFNGNTHAFVSWNWKAGTSFTNDASGTGIGSLDSTGSVNDTAGFSIVSYTGNTTAGATIKHGLSTKPDVIICKARQNSGGVIEWVVYHKGISTPQNNTLCLNTDAAKVDRTIAWNDTAPTSSVFSVGTWVGTNAQVPMIAYCFSEKKGYSKFGSYKGNGNANGTFIYTGFKVSFILGKRTDSGGGWWILDSKRPGFNLTDEYLLANDAQAEADDGSFASDFLSNGWKARATNGNFNASGGSYIYMAFAENPFTTSTGVPATAR